MAAEVARFFHDLRGALRLTPAQTAQALATRVDIIAALEMGQIGALAAVAGDMPHRAHLRGLRWARPASGPAFAGAAVYVLEPRAASKVRGPRRNFIPNLGKQGAPIMAAIGGGGRRAAECGAQRASGRE